MTTMPTPIPQPVTAWLEATMGPHRWLDTIQDKDRATVWRIATRDTELIVKLLKTPDRWQREVHAYRYWTGTLGEQAPTLVAASPELQCLVLSALRGGPMKYVRVNEVLTRAAYSAAGRLARRFRNAALGSFIGDPDATGRPLGPSWHDPLAYISFSFMPTYQRVLRDGGLDARAQAVADWAEGNLSAFARCPIVPVNPDFDTGNWLVDEQTGFHRSNRL